MSDDLQLYEVSISVNATMYVLAEDEDDAYKIAEREGSDALLFAHIDVDEVEEVESIKDIAMSERIDKPYSSGGQKLSIEEWFAERDSASPDGPIVSCADLEAAGQLRLPE